MKILHNMIVYPKVKIYSSRSSADSFDDYVLYLLFVYLYIIELDNKIIYYQFMKNNSDMNFIN